MIRSTDSSFSRKTDKSGHPHKKLIHTGQQHLSDASATQKGQYFRSAGKPQRSWFWTPPNTPLLKRKFLEFSPGQGTRVLNLASFHTKKLSKNRDSSSLTAACSERSLLLQHHIRVPLRRTISQHAVAALAYHPQHFPAEENGRPGGKKKTKRMRGPHDRPKTTKGLNTANSG